MSEHIATIDVATLIAENRELRELLQGMRDRIKFESNSDGGWVAHVDAFLKRMEESNG